MASHRNEIDEAAAALAADIDALLCIIKKQKELIHESI